MSVAAITLCEVIACVVLQYLPWFPITTLINTKGRIYSPNPLNKEKSIYSKILLIKKLVAATFLHFRIQAM